MLNAETLAKAERRPMASMVVALVEAALKIPKYREILHAQPNGDQTLINKMRLDTLTPERLKELQALLGILENLKSQSNKKVVIWKEK